MTANRLSSGIWPAKAPVVAGPSVSRSSRRRRQGLASARHKSAETADLHERFSPGNPGWGHPPLEEEVRMTDEGWGLVTDPGSLFGPTVVRWYPAVQWFDGDGFADLPRSSSLYRRLDGHVRDPLLDAIAWRIRTQMGGRASRRYLSVLRAGRRAE
jgi:hypothetical protein